MPPADVEKLRTLTEIARRYRRENDRLREQAGLESQASKKDMAARFAETFATGLAIGSELAEKSKQEKEAE